MLPDLFAQQIPKVQRKWCTLLLQQQLCDTATLAPIYLGCCTHTWAPLPTFNAGCSLLPAPADIVVATPATVAAAALVFYLCKVQGTFAVFWLAYWSAVCCGIGGCSACYPCACHPTMVADCWFVGAAAPGARYILSSCLMLSQAQSVLPPDWPVGLPSCLLALACPQQSTQTSSVFVH